VSADWLHFYGTTAGSPDVHGEPYRAAARLINESVHGDWAHRVYVVTVIVRAGYTLTNRAVVTQGDRYCVRVSIGGGTNWCAELWSMAGWQIVAEGTSEDPSFFAMLTTAIQVRDAIPVLSIGSAGGSPDGSDRSS